MAETDHTLNPAGRLHLAFQFMQAPQRKATPYREILQEYFSVSDHSDVLRHYAALCSLPGQVRDMFEQCELPSLFLEELPKFESWFLNVQLQVKPQQSGGSVGESQMLALRHVSALLALQSTERRLDPEAEASIVELLDELDLLIAECNLPEPIPQILSKSVARMREALSMSIVLGTDPLLQEVYRSRGAVVSHYPIFAENEEHEVIKKFGVLLQTVAAAVTVLGFTHPQLAASAFLGLAATP